MGKKSNWNNTAGMNKVMNQSPSKKPKSIETDLMNTDDEPNYAKPTHNIKRKFKQNTVGKSLSIHILDEQEQVVAKPTKPVGQTAVNPEVYLRASVDTKRKKANPKGLHDWKRLSQEENNMQESKTPYNVNKNPPLPFKKSTSLYEARNKHKTDRAKNDRFRKSDNFNDNTDDDRADFAMVPRLIPAKSSPINQQMHDDEQMYSLPSYRNHEEYKVKGEPFEEVENWEVSRIEPNSDIERSFKKEMHSILPLEEHKAYGYEVEKRLEDLEDDGKTNRRSKKKEVKKASASPASEEKMGMSMMTSNKDTSKHDLSKMMISIDQYIYVISGYKNTTLSSVERLNMNKGIWQPVSDVNIARTKFGSVSVKGAKIYLLGGKLVDGSRTDIIEEYDVASDTWAKITIKMPSPRSGFSCALLNEKQLMTIGGNDGQVLDNVDLLNFSTGIWSELPQMSTKRDELAVTVGPDGKIYAIGGYGGQNSTCLKSVERFNLQTYEWEKIADLNEPRRALAAVSLPDGVYAIGGYNGSRYLGSMERYDEVKNRWVKCAEMNSPRCTLSAVSSND